MTQYIFSAINDSAIKSLAMCTHGLIVGLIIFFVVLFGYILWRSKKDNSKIRERIIKIFTKHEFAIELIVLILVVLLSYFFSDGSNYRWIGPLLLGIFAIWAVKGLKVKSIYAEYYEKVLFIKKYGELEHIINEVKSDEAKNNIFKEKINLLRSNKTCRTKWIVSVFILKQLDSNFGELTFSIKGTDYSLFAQKLFEIYDDKKHYQMKKKDTINDKILLTCSLNPYEWIKSLYMNSEEIMPNLATKKKFNNWPDKNNLDLVPNYIKALKEVPKEKRKRLIVIDEPKYFFLTETYYLYFKHLNAIEDCDKNTCFVTYDTLNKTLTYIKDIEVERYDYAIFNGEIALKWKMPDSDYSKETDLVLIDLHSSANSKFRRAIEKIYVEDWNCEGNGFITVANMKKNINDSKIVFLESITKIPPNPTIHSCCYHVHGADCWNEITDDQDLVRREQYYINEKFLPDLSKTLGKNSTIKYNILHIGVGSGIEIENIITNISKLKKEINKYAILDFSFHIIERVKEKIKLSRKNKAVVEFIYSDPFDLMDTDIDLDKVSYYDVFRNNIFHADNIKEHPIIIILIANGYLLSQKSLLKNIFNFMRQRDYLLITTEINNSVANSIIGKKKNEINLNKIIKPYKSQSGLKLFNTSLNVFGIDTTEEDGNINADYYDFGFPNSVEGYKNDIFVGNFLLKEWKNKGNVLHPNDVFDDVNEKTENVFQKFYNMQQIQIFQSFKPSSKKSMEDYLKNFRTDEYKFVIKNTPDFNYKSTHNQVGFVIQKEKKK
ncbi:MAG: hypothetical protein LBC85_09250 [Fibromonadaceae bacterium]|jgi:uncharacterized Tic20 family protein|nr:hypothetical protein [Fibromonadaceae bacterium]